MTANDEAPFAELKIQSNLTSRVWNKENMKADRIVVAKSALYSPWLVMLLFEPKEMRKLRRLLVGVVAVVVVSSATGAGSGSDAPLHSVRTITVSQDVAVPKEMVFAGFSQVMEMGLGAGLAGPVGAGIAAGNLSRKGDAAFGIAGSVRSAMITEISRSGKFVVKESGPADAALQLRVIGYGFYSAGMFARRVRPLLGFEAKLVRSDGQVTWRHRCAVTQMNHETPTILPETIRQDPRIGAEALRVAARVCARKAVASLK